MKKLFLLLHFAFYILHLQAQNNIGIGTSVPDASSLVDVSSTTKGMLVPRMNSAQRTAIASPATGLLVFDTNTESFWFKNATHWTELVDTSNSLLKQNGNNLYTSGNTRLGMGISTPLYDVHIKQANASIALQDAATNRISATITADDSDVLVNAFRGGSVGGNIIFQRSSAVPALSAGNVGIGVPFTSSPMEKLQVNGNLRLQDADARLALHNGSTERGFLYLSGNDLRVGTSAGNTTGRLILSTQAATHLALTSTGELQRPNVTGAANLLPLAFGRVSTAGTVVNGTGNFTVQKVSTGLFKITLSGESNVYANQANYLILITPYNSLATTSRALSADAGIVSDNTVEVRITRPRVYYDNDACPNSCGPFSYISTIKFYDEADGDFSILIYKQ